MKKILWLPALLWLMTGMSFTAANKPTPTDGGKPGIMFTPGRWKDILKKAKAENKLIFFDAYTSWCGPCKAMQKNVFTRKDVGDYFNQRFINVKIDMEEGEGPALAEKYPLEGYPTLFFIDGNGRVVKQLLGGRSAGDLLAEAKSVSGVSKNL
jgi:thioredoxin 1